MEMMVVDRDRILYDEHVMKSEKDLFLELIYTASDVFSCHADDPEDSNLTFGLYIGYPLLRIHLHGLNYIIHCRDDILLSSYSENRKVEDFVKRCYDQCTDEEINEIIRFHDL